MPSVEEILNDLAEKKEGRWTVKEGLERLEVGNEEFVEGRGEGCLDVKGVIMGDGYGGRLRNLRGWNGFQPNLPFDTEVDVVTRIGEEVRDYEERSDELGVHQLRIIVVIP